MNLFEYLFTNSTRDIKYFIPYFQTTWLRKYTAILNYLTFIKLKILQKNKCANYPHLTIFCIWFHKKISPISLSFPKTIYFSSKIDRLSRICTILVKKKYYIIVENFSLSQGIIRIKLRSSNRYKRYIIIIVIFLVSRRAAQFNFWRCANKKQP